MGCKDSKIRNEDVEKVAHKAGEGIGKGVASKVMESDSESDRKRRGRSRHRKHHKDKKGRRSDDKRKRKDDKRRHRRHHSDSSSGSDEDSDSRSLRSTSSNSSVSSRDHRRHHRDRKKGKKDKRGHGKNKRSESSSTESDRSSSGSRQRRSSESNSHDSNASASSSSEDESLIRQLELKERKIKAIEEQNVIRKLVNKLPSDERSLKKEITNIKIELENALKEKAELNDQLELDRDEHESKLAHAESRVEQLEIKCKDLQQEVSQYKTALYEKDGVSGGGGGSSGNLAALSKKDKEIAELKKQMAAVEADLEKQKNQNKFLDAKLAKMKEEVAKNDGDRKSKGAGAPSSDANSVSLEEYEKLQAELKERNAIVEKVVTFVVSAGDMYTSDILEEVCLDAIALCTEGEDDGSSGSMTPVNGGNALAHKNSGLSATTSNSLTVPSGLGSSVGPGSPSRQGSIAPGSPTNTGVIIDFNGKSFGDCMSFLAANIVRQNPRVTEIDLSECDLTDAGIGVIAVTMNLCGHRLRVLNAAANERITYRGAFVLLRAVRKTVDEIPNTGGDQTQWKFTLGLKANDHIWEEMSAAEEYHFRALSTEITTLAPNVVLDLPNKPAHIPERVFSEEDIAAANNNGSSGRFKFD